MIPTMTDFILVKLFSLSSVSSSLLTVLETTSDLGVFDPNIAIGAEVDNSWTLVMSLFVQGSLFTNSPLILHNVSCGGTRREYTVAQKLGLLLGLTILFVFGIYKSGIMSASFWIMGKTSSSEYLYSMFGRMTDMNMWSRSLTEVEAVSWTLCRTREGGDLVDWKTATWEARGLQELQVEREEVCRQRKDRLLLSKVKSDFDASLHLARMVGGTMAIAGSQEEADDIILVLVPQKKSVDRFSQDSQTGRGKVTGSTSTHRRNWKTGEPNGNGNEDCATIYALTNNLSDVKCSKKLCSIFQLRESPKFQMRGVCKERKVDTYYTMPVPRSNETIF